MENMHKPAAWQWFAVMLTLSYFVYYLFTVPIGDDLNYGGIVTGANSYCGPWWKYILFMCHHWLSSNGRWGNYVMPFVTAMPAIVRAAAVAIAIGAFYWQCVKLVRLRHNSAWAVVLMCAICLLMPWWDSFQVFAVPMNYTVPSVFILWMLDLLFFTDRKIRWWECGIFFLAGCSHEAAAAPLGLGLLIYYIARMELPERRVRKALGWFVVAAVLCVLCPGIIRRAGNLSAPDDAPWLLFLKSDFLTIPLWAGCIVGTMTRHGRKWVAGFLQTPWGVLTVAAMASSVLSALTGIVGRSGWYAQLFALLAMCGYRVSKGALTGGKWPAYILGVFVAAHLVAVDYWQAKFGREHRMVTEMFTQSQDGVIYADITPDDRQPAWLTLWRPRGLQPPQDRDWDGRMSLFWRRDSALLVVLPTDARGVIPFEQERTDLSDGSYLTHTLPADTTPFAWGTPPLRDKWKLLRPDGDSVMIRINGDTYFVTPIVIHPGDRP